MLAPTKKHPTKHKTVRQTRENNHESMDWREVFKDYGDDEIIPATLRGARTKEGLTQKELSAISSIPQGHISEMETGKRQIGVKVAKKLGKALNISYKIFL